MGSFTTDIVPHGNAQYSAFLFGWYLSANGPGDNNWVGGLQYGVSCEPDEYHVGNFGISQSGFPTGFPFSVQYTMDGATSPSLPYLSDNSSEIGTASFVGDGYTTPVGFVGTVRLSIVANVAFEGNYPGGFYPISLERAGFIPAPPPVDPEICDCCCCLADE